MRQLAGRARRHVDERRPRYEVDPAERRDLTERFLAAAAGGDLDGLMSLLAPDVRLVGDSGGKAQGAAAGPGDAPTRWAASCIGVAGKGGSPTLSFRFLEINGGSAVLVLSGGKPDSVFQLDVAGRPHPVRLHHPQPRQAAVPGRPLTSGVRTLSVRTPRARCPVNAVVRSRHADRGLVLTKGGGRPMVAEKCNNL